MEGYDITSYIDATGLLKELKPVFIETFLNLNIRFYDKQQKQNFIQNMSEKLSNNWNKKTKKLLNDLKNKTISKVYITVVRDDKSNIVGFALLKGIDLPHFLNVSLERTIEDYGKYKISGEEIYLSLLAVVPKLQKKGLGKKLLFSIFNFFPEINEIFLVTYANNVNRDTQKFYEHLGFIKILKGTFKLKEDEPELAREKIVYLFKK